jgi:hypothetical protein
VIIAVSGILLLHLFITHVLLVAISPPSRVSIMAHWLEVVPEVSVVGALRLALSSQVFDDVPDWLGILEHIQQDIIRNFIGYAMHASVEACLKLPDVLLVPDACNY